MSYVHGASQLKLTAEEIRKVDGQIKHIQTKLDTAKRQQAHWSEELAKQRAATREVQQQVTNAREHHTRAIITAQGQERAILLAAEREADQIMERAHRQAWVLRDRAYTSGTDRALDAALARSSVLTRNRH